MFDLDARVALDEVVLAALRCHQELDGAGVDVVGSFHELDGVGENSIPKRIVETRGRRGLDDLLIAQLHRAVSFMQMQDVAVAIGQDLDLDVARTFDQFLDEEITVAEGARGFTPATLERLGHGIRVNDDAHASTAATARGLEHHGVPQLLGDSGGAINRLECLGTARHHRNPKGRSQGAGLHLVAEQRQRLR